MTVTLNGAATELPDGATIGDAIIALERDPAGRGVAVAVNGEVVPRGTWDRITLAQGDKVEVLTAVAGG